MIFYNMLKTHKNRVKIRRAFRALMYQVALINRLSRKLNNNWHVLLDDPAMICRGGSLPWTDLREFIRVLSVLTSAIMEEGFRVLPSRVRMALQEEVNLRDGCLIWDANIVLLTLRALLWRALSLTTSYSDMMRLALALRFTTREYAIKMLGLEEGDLLFLKRVLGLKEVYHMPDDVIYCARHGGLCYLLLKLNEIIYEIYDALTGMDQLLSISFNPRTKYLISCFEHLRKVRWRFPEPLFEFYMRARKEESWYGHFVLVIEGAHVVAIQNIYPVRLADVSMLLTWRCDLPLKGLLEKLMPAITIGLLEANLKREGREIILTILSPFLEQLMGVGGGVHNQKG